MNVLGYLYKQNLIIFTIAWVLLSICCFGVTIVFAFESIPIIAKILIMSFFFIIGAISVVFGISDIYVQVNANEQVLLFDENNKTFIVNSIKRKIEFSVCDIEKFKCCNKEFFPSIIPPLFIEKHYGRIKFTLKDGTKIKTLKMKDIKKVFKELNMIKINKKTESSIEAV